MKSCHKIEQKTFWKQYFYFLWNGKYYWWKTRTRPLFLNLVPEPSNLRYDDGVHNRYLLHIFTGCFPEQVPSAQFHVWWLQKDSKVHQKSDILCRGSDRKQTVFSVMETVYTSNRGTLCCNVSIPENTPIDCCIIKSCSSPYVVHLLHLCNEQNKVQMCLLL